MRYHANGAKPGAPHELQKRLDDEQRRRRTPSRSRPRSRAPRAGRDCAATSSRLVRERRGHRRHREEERELRRRGAIEPHGHAADDRRARPRHARDQRQRLARRRCRARARAASARRRAPSGAGRNRSTSSITMPPSDERDGDHREAVVEDALRRSPTAARRRPAPGASPPAIIAAKWRASGSTAEPDHDVDDLRAIQPHDREDRAELNHHGEDAARIVEAEQPARRCSRCAVDETGRNSVTPCTMPSSAAEAGSIDSYERSVALRRCALSASLRSAASAAAAPRPARRRRRRVRRGARRRRAAPEADDRRGDEHASSRCR